MGRRILKVIAVIGAAVFLSNCVANQNSRHDDPCLKAGVAKGSQAYDDCAAREKAQVLEMKSRLNSTRAYNR